MSKDFTLNRYEQYIKALQKGSSPFVRFDDFFKRSDIPGSFILLRHDVDRKPENALKMARLENDLGVQSTYYFRTKQSVLKSPIVREIEKMGHEIGYHYENLSDAKGDKEKALEDFKTQLSKIREIASVNTIAMHGRPLSKFDNRDLWKSEKNKELLLDELNILGEVYLDIDYSDIVYIGDTGRNWHSSKSNVRDKVHSKVTPDFTSGDDLLSYFENEKPKKMVFQIHPERWSDTTIDYLSQSLKDMAANTIKKLL